MTIRTFRDLIVWQKAHSLVIEVYDLTAAFPNEERFGIISQMRRSAFSVAANIVEGFKRKSKKDYAHFINMSETSLEEAKYQLLLAKDLGCIKSTEYEKLGEKCDEIGKMLHGLYKNLTT